MPTTGFTNIPASTAKATPMITSGAMDALTSTTVVVPCVAARTSRLMTAESQDRPVEKVGPNRNTPRASSRDTLAFQRPSAAVARSSATVGVSSVVGASPTKLTVRVFHRNCVRGSDIM